MTSPLPINPPLPFRIEGGTRAIIPIHPDWNEGEVMRWLAGLLRKPGAHYPEHDTPPFPRGGHWQLDGNNDYWAELRTVPPTAEGTPARTELILTARYLYQPLMELAAWAAVRLGPL